MTGNDRSAQVKYYHKNRERLDSESRLWRENNKERMRLYAQKYRLANPDRVRQQNRNTIYKKYGITEQYYINLLEKQKGVCAICNKEETTKHRSGTIKKLSVDHCHKTGKVRGLLCQGCNHALGNYEKIKLGAEKYLNKCKGDI